MADNMALAAEFERVLRTGDMAALSKLTQDWATDDFIQAVRGAVLDRAAPERPQEAYA